MNVSLEANGVLASARAGMDIKPFENVCLGIADSASELAERGTFTVDAPDFESVRLEAEKFGGLIVGQ